MSGKVEKKIKLNSEGLPVDANDWTVEDWIDLHTGLQKIFKKISARHSTKPDAPYKPPSCKRHRSR